MHITKMEGLGNDYLYVYGAPKDAAALAVRLSDRHFGVGADGMIWIEPSEIADFRMRIFNADGSEAEMCGNGIRCAAKYVYDKGYTQKTSLRIETLSGVRTVHLLFAGGNTVGATVEMGLAVGQTPISLSLDGVLLTVYPVSIGNPHAVTFVEQAETFDVERFGCAMQSFFPKGINAEFVSVVGDNALRMRVYERGNGVTLACGTGACAAAYAAWTAGLCAKTSPITVCLDGGMLSIALREDGQIEMTGPAVTVFEGEVAQ